MWSLGLIKLLRGVKQLYRIAQLKCVLMANLHRTSAAKLWDARLQKLLMNIRTHNQAVKKFRLQIIKRAAFWDKEKNTGI